MRYYIIAGEASGDLHGANLMRALLRQDADAHFRFWGGDAMQDVAGPPVRHIRDLAIMGFVEVVSHLGTVLGNIRFCKEDILQYRPDVLITIDYPGFNFKIAKFAHESGIKVFYYIAPKTWASREKRNASLKAWVDRLFIIFPFEKEYFGSRGIPYSYKGNPLIDAVDDHEFSPPVEGSYIALLAGSNKKSRGCCP